MTRWVPSIARLAIPLCLASVALGAALVSGFTPAPNGPRGT